MKISLRLFAGLRDAIGVRELAMDVDDGSTVSDLRERLGREYPRVQPMLKTAVFAMDDEYVAFDEKLREGAQVALIPPVSGGDEVHLEDADGLFRLTTRPMEAEAGVLAELVRDDEDGAVALFYGVVRNFSEGRDVERLEYEAHETMALRKMREAAEETKRRFPEVTEVGVWHRIGMLEIGETSLLVAVSSPHRKEAFEACHWAVDHIKEIVPVFKKEHWAGGAAWVEGHAVDAPETTSA